VRYDYYDSGVRSFLYIAITGSEEVNEETYIWFEAVKRTGAAVVATRQLVPGLGADGFADVTGGYLSGAKRFWVKRGNAAPVELHPSRKNGAPINLERIFVENDTADVTEREVTYVTGSGKVLDCVLKTYRLQKGGESVFLHSADVPVTGIARIESSGIRIELIDFGFSGSDSVF
jgi:hypothetical protein